MSIYVRDLVNMSRSRMLEDDDPGPDTRCRVIVARQDRIEMDEAAAATVVGCLTGPATPGCLAPFRAFIAGDEPQLIALMQSIGFSLASDVLGVTPSGQLSHAQELFGRLRQAFSLGIGQAMLQRLVERL